MQIYLIRNEAILSELNVAIAAISRVDAIGQLLRLFDLYGKADIMKLEERCSGSHTIFKVYLNDEKHTEYRFIVSG